MNRNTRTSLTLDVTIFNRQRALIEKMVSDLQRGRTAFAIRMDTNDLSGILAILDEINDQNDLDGIDSCVEETGCPACTDMETTLECPDCDYNNGTVNIEDDGEGPTCPGCTSPNTLDECPDCEYCSDCDQEMERVSFDG
jgi:hypothetical protein